MIANVTRLATIAVAVLLLSACGTSKPTPAKTPKCTYVLAPGESC